MVLMVSAKDRRGGQTADARRYFYRVKGRLMDGNADVVGVGQGKQTVREALPKQMEVVRTLRNLSPSSTVLSMVDSDGERGVVIMPRLHNSGWVRGMGSRFGQRSVLHGLAELSTHEGDGDRHLTDFDVKYVGTRKPEGFFTYIPSLGLYYQLVPVKAHMRAGRPVVGYATRRRRRAA